MYDELVKRLRDGEYEIDCSLCDRDCCYPSGKVHGKCAIIEAADAIEELATNYDAATDIMKHQTEYIEELEANKPRWIPVTERLPERIRKSYLCLTDTGYHCEVRWTNNVYGLLTSSMDNEWGWSIADVPQFCKITHWMPLPEPPKEG